MCPASAITYTADTLQTIIDVIPMPVALMDPAARVVLANDAFCAMVNMRRDAFVGMPAEGTIRTGHEAALVRNNRAIFASRKPDESEELLAEPGGAVKVLRTFKSLVTLSTRSGPVDYLMVAVQDVTGLREREARIKYLVERDALTGLPNRIQFEGELAATLARDDADLALLVVDCDGFKAINERHGRQVGDDVLRIIARRLAKMTGAADAVARSGGDRFCLLAHVPGTGEALAFARRVQAEVVRPVVLDDQTVQIRASIGMALTLEDSRDAGELQRRAEAALNIEKRMGGGGIRRLSLREVEEASTADWDIAADLHRALEAGELFLVYQPVVAAGDGALRGYEALLRWAHPARGIIGPHILVPVAEESGLIVEVGAHVLRLACAAARDWPGGLRVAVNVSPVQLARPDFPKTVAAILAETGLAPERLELEVTETAILGHTEQMVRAFEALKALGLAIALDDFGAGWSSLATLRHFPFDRLKVDRGFVSRIELDPRSVAIVRAVLGLGASLGVPVTAEGVETLGQLRILRRLGCNEIQGYLIGRPAPDPQPPETDAWAELGD